jgi:hypothetical protein
MSGIHDASTPDAQQSVCATIAVLSKQRSNQREWGQHTCRRTSRCSQHAHLFIRARSMAFLTVRALEKKGNSMRRPMYSRNFADALSSRAYCRSRDMSCGSRAAMRTYCIATQTSVYWVRHDNELEGSDINCENCVAVCATRHMLCCVILLMHGMQTKILRH